MRKNRISTGNIVTAALVIAFFTGIVLIYYSMLVREKRDNIIRTGEITAKESAEQIDQYLSTNIDSVNLAAYTLDEMIREHSSDDEIKDYIVGLSTAVRSAVIENSTGLYGYINGKFISGTNWEPPEGYVATDRPWYKKPMEDPGRMTILDPYVDVQSGNIMLALGRTLCDGKSVISVDVSLERIQDLTEEAVKSGNSDMEIILNDSGVVIAHSDRNEIGKDYSGEKGTLGAEIFLRVKGTNADSFEYFSEGSRYIIYVADMQNGWSCISVKDATGVFGSLNLIFFATITVVIVIILIISLIMARSTRYHEMSIRATAESEAKSAFLSNMSHELRTPINAILGMNEMILRESRDASILKYSDNIRTAGKNLLGLVNDILYYSQKKTGEDVSGKPSEKAEMIFGGLIPETEKKYERFTARDARILVVDDNPMNLMVFESLVKQTEAAVDTAGGGDECIERTMASTYDMIFLDHMMPGKDGIETLLQIRENGENPNRNTPVICLTANAIDGAKEKYLEAGFDDYLTKPIDPDRLEEMICSFLPEEKISFCSPVEEDDRDVSDVNLPPGSEGLLRAGINTEAGLKNSGTAGAYLALLKVFYESLDEKTRELDALFAEDDIKNYTIKVHALKSSARIIGAADFGERAQKLEDAGKRGDTAYIRKMHEGFMADLQEFRGPLSDIFEKPEEKDNRPEADEMLMKDFFEEVRQAAEDMDCERLEDMIGEMKEYRIPEDDLELFGKVKEAADRYDYKAIVDLFLGEADSEEGKEEK